MRPKHIVSWNGQDYTFDELGETIGLSGPAMRQRLIRWDWDVDKALSLPLQRSGISDVASRGEAYTGTNESQRRTLAEFERLAVSEDNFRNLKS